MRAAAFSMAAAMVLGCAIPGRASPEYRVLVNDRPVEVLDIPAPSHHDWQLPDEAAQPYWAALFDAEGEVTVRVESESDLSATRILPLSRGIAPRMDGAHALEFTATPPFTVSVEPRPRHGALVVSARPPDPAPPDPGDSAVKWFGPGRHHFDKPIELHSGETLYLAPGAFVEAAVIGTGTNITVRGHGVLSGLCWPHYGGPANHMLHFEGADITLRDFTVIGSFHWTVVLNKVEGARVEGLNILGGHVLNDDGIDVCRSRDVSVRDCFIRTQDDCVCAKYWCENLSVENCTLWADVANIFRIGCECDGPERRFSGIRASGIDVVHQAVANPRGWQHAVNVEASNGTIFENLVFEGFRFDSVKADDLLASVKTGIVRNQWRRDETAGYIRSVTFRDIVLPADAPKGACNVISVRGHDAEHAVEGVAGECADPRIRIEFVPFAATSVTLASPFSDGAVLQRGMRVPVWGAAKPGERVRVSFAGQTVEATADADGRWRADLAPMETCREGRTLTATGSSGGAPAEARGVLVGEVWFCSGQSNVELPLVGGSPRFRDGKGAMRAQMTDKPLVRFCCHSTYKASAEPRRECRWKSEWRPFTPENLQKPSFSAMGVYFALELFSALDVPIGIVGAWWGGTPIEAWTPAEGLASVPETAALAEVEVKGTPDFPGEGGFGNWKRAQDQPRVLWNDMLAPLAPYAMRGFIWYQGENNVADGAAYAPKMRALYNGWAREFENPDLRIRFVQLAPWGDDRVPALQMAQAKFAAEEPNAAMATVNDVGNLHDIHYADKETVGQRLALLALEHDYGLAVESDSPVPREWRVKDDAFVVEFDHAKALYLYNPDKSLDAGLEICGADGKWRPAIIRNLDGIGGKIAGPRLVAAAAGVDVPVKLRYLHSRPWFGCIRNEANLPSGPFELESQ